MPVPISRLALTVEKRRGEGTPVHAGRFEWEGDELPNRMVFMASVEAAYEGIELPWFPFRAYVEVVVDGTSSPVEAGEPQDEEAVGLLLWNAVVTAASGCA